MQLHFLLVEVSIFKSVSGICVDGQIRLKNTTSTYMKKIFVFENTLKGPKVSGIINRNLSLVRSALTLTLLPNASSITHQEGASYTLLQGVPAQIGPMILDDLGGKTSRTVLECFQL